jgi:hypothetical protein
VGPCGGESVDQDYAAPAGAIGGAQVGVTGAGVIYFDAHQLPVATL